MSIWLRLVLLELAAETVPFEGSETPEDPVGLALRVDAVTKVGCLVCPDRKKDTLKFPWILKGTPPCKITKTKTSS